MRLKSCELLIIKNEFAKTNVIIVNDENVNKTVE